MLGNASGGTQNPSRPLGFRPRLPPAAVVSLFLSNIHARMCVWVYKTKGVPKQRRGRTGGPRELPAGSKRHFQPVPQPPPPPVARGPPYPSLPTRCVPPQTFPPRTRADKKERAGGTRREASGGTLGGLCGFSRTFAAPPAAPFPPGSARTPHGTLTVSENDSDTQKIQSVVKSLLAGRT